jgi:predicted  nucleic acid-binding Zn-ribbon protein
VAVELAPAVVSVVGGIVTAWLRHRGRVQRVELERDAAREEVARLRDEVDELRDEILRLERAAARQPEALNAGRG